MRRGNPDRLWTANFKAVSAATFVPLIAPVHDVLIAPALRGRAGREGL